MRDDLTYTCYKNAVRSFMVNMQRRDKAAM